MEKLAWFDRTFAFGLSKGMLPFYLERLEGTYPRLLQKLKGIPDEKLSRQINGKWSVKQNIGHLTEVDEIANLRIDQIVSGVPTLASAVFELRVNYNKLPIEEVLERFLKNRRSNVAIYHALNDVDLDKSSLHPRLKLLITPVDLAWFDAEHDDHHLVTINELLSSMSVKIQTSVRLFV